MPHKPEQAGAKRSVREAESAKKGHNLPPSASSLRNDTPRNASRILNALTSRQKFRERGGRSGEDKGEMLPRKKKKAIATDATSSSAQGRQRGSASSSNPGPVGGDAGGASGKGKQRAMDLDTTKVPIPPIRPHESMRDYNYRIESLFRPEITSAMKSAETIRSEQAKLAGKDKQARREKGQGQAKDSDPKKGTEVEKDGGKGKKRPRDEEGDYLEPEDRPVKVFAPKPAPRRLNDIAQAPPTLPQLRGVKDENGNRLGRDSGKGGKGAFSSLGRDPLNAGQKRLLEEERERVVKRYREMKEEREAAKAAQGRQGTKSAA